MLNHICQNYRLIIIHIVSMICMCTNYFKHNLQLVNKFLTDIELVRLFLHHHLMLLQVLLQVGCHAKLFVTVDTVEVKLVRCLLVCSQVPLVEEDHRALFTLDRPVHLVVHNLVREKREQERERREEKNLVLVQILLRGARPPADPAFPQIHSRCPSIFLLRLLLLIVSMFTLFCPLSCLPPQFLFFLAKEIF